MLSYVVNRNLAETYGQGIEVYQRMGDDAIISILEGVFRQHRRYKKTLEKLSADLDSFKEENGI